MKEVKGFEGLYSSTEDGFIFSHIFNKYLKGTPDKDGYLRVSLSKNGKSFNRIVHRLVLESFVSNPLNKPQVNHINGVKDDNRLCNLEWCTPSENSIHAFKAGLRPLTRGQSDARRRNMIKVNDNYTVSKREYNRKVVSETNSKKVINNKTKEVYDSALKLSKHLGINYNTLKWRMKHNKCEYSYVIK